MNTDSGSPSAEGRRGGSGGGGLRMRRAQDAEERGAEAEAFRAGGKGPLAVYVAPLFFALFFTVFFSIPKNSCF